MAKTQDELTVVGDNESGCNQCGKPFLWLSLQGNENSNCTIVLPQSVLDSVCLCHLDSRVKNAE